MAGLDGDCSSWQEWGAKVPCLLASPGYPFSTILSNRVAEVGALQEPFFGASQLSEAAGRLVVGGLACMLWQAC